MIDDEVAERRVSLLPAIERSRLISEFRAADPQIVKLIAPAGYGKTTLAAALAVRGESVARCDVLHVASAVSLIRAVLEAIAKTLAHDDRVRISDAFISLGDSEPEWLRYARRVIERNRMPAMLVFDNGEALVDKPEVRRVIERLLTELSPRPRIVFCSRVDVAVNFARYAGPERTMRIGPEELRFDRGEIAQLLSSVGANASVVARVDSFTHGWPMLVMMLYVLAKRGRLEAYLAGIRPDVSDLYGYLASQVLATLEPRARDVLEAVAALPEARPGDLEALYGGSAGACIAELETATPFLSRTARGTLEVHPAIAETFAKESMRGVELAREIGAALAASQPVRSARIAAHLGEYDRAASLLEGARYFLRTPSLDLVEVLYALPPEALIRYPSVWNVASYSRALTRHATEWLHEADRVLAAMPDDAPLDVRVELFSGFMNVYTQRGEFAKARRFSAAFAQTPAGVAPMGSVTIRFWELAAATLLGAFADREEWERELGPIMRIKTIEIITDCDIFARHERLAGNAVTERAILCRALDEARASGDVLLRYLALTEALFGAWFWGDDGRFRALIDDFERAVHPATEPATTLLLAACRSRVTPADHGTEQLKVRTYAYLIAAARERDCQRRQTLLREAVVTADECAQPFTSSIARVALGVAEGEAGAKTLEEARELAGRTWSTVFAGAVDHVRCGRFTGHMLAAFAKRYDREFPEVRSVASKRIEISLVHGTVRVADRSIGLSGREFELLALLALRAGPSATDVLTEALWPDSDPERSRSSLKATLSRLRRRLGDGSLVVASPHGYHLAAEATIDLTALLESRAAAEGLPARTQLEAARRRLSRWAWAKAYEVRIEGLEALANDIA